MSEIIVSPALVHSIDTLLKEVAFLNTENKLLRAALLAWENAYQGCHAPEDMGDTKFDTAVFLTKEVLKDGK